MNKKGVITAPIMTMLYSWALLILVFILFTFLFTPATQKAEADLLENTAEQRSLELELLTWLRAPDDDFLTNADLIVLAQTKEFNTIYEERRDKAFENLVKKLDSKKEIDESRIILRYPDETEKTYGSTFQDTNFIIKHEFPLPTGGMASIAYYIDE